MSARRTKILQIVLPIAIVAILAAIMIVIAISPDISLGQKNNYDVYLRLAIEECDENGEAVGTYYEFVIRVGDELEYDLFNRVGDAFRFYRPKILGYYVPDDPECGDAFFDESIDEMFQWKLQYVNGSKKSDVSVITGGNNEYIFTVKSIYSARKTGWKTATTKLRIYTEQ